MRARGLMLLGENTALISGFRKLLIGELMNRSDEPAENPYEAAIRQGRAAQRAEDADALEDAQKQIQALTLRLVEDVAEHASRMH